MLYGNKWKSLHQGPLPPMALADYETMSKFLDAAARRCRESGRSFNLFLDWAIHALADSLCADSASRIFLPKTETAPFFAQDLLPLPELPPAGQVRVSLRSARVIAPVWNNGDLMQAMEAFYDSGFQDAQIDRPFAGFYLKELDLAVVDSPEDVDVPHLLRAWGRGSILLNAYSLKDLEPLLSTDGRSWYLRESDGAERALPVLEPRMAALYLCALRRYCP